MPRCTGTPRKTSEPPWTPFASPGPASSWQGSRRRRAGHLRRCGLRPPPRSAASLPTRGCEGSCRRATEGRPGSSAPAAPLEPPVQFARTRPSVSTVTKIATATAIAFRTREITARPYVTSILSVERGHEGPRGNCSIFHPSWLTNRAITGRPQPRPLSRLHSWPCRAGRARRRCCIPRSAAACGTSGMGT
jgi:hypothetical protein